MASLTPTLTAPTATSTNGNALSYAIRVTTGYDGMSGQVALSPVCAASGSACVLNTTTGTVSWPVPAGLLTDGSSYTWDEVVNDGDDDWTSPVQRMTENLRITDPGPAPTDTEGPVTVNLANGNASVSFDSPTVQTVGGPMGMSFNYNSELASNAGLNGSYYNVTPASGSPDFSFTSSSLPAPSIVRTDPTVAFDWDGNQSPGPGIPTTDFMAQWTGYMSPPAGDYYFGFERDDGANLMLGSGSTQTTVLSQWTDNSGYKPQWGTASTQELVVSDGQAKIDGQTYDLPIPITVQYYQNQGYAHVFLEVEDAPGSTDAQVVPASWFTKTAPTLPSGWSTSSPLMGTAAEYVSAQNHEGYVTLTDVNGGTHTYTKTSTGGYTPPPGETGTLTTDQNGELTFTDSSGNTYLFNAAGQVTSVTSPTDNGKPAEPVPTYDSDGQLTSLSNPLSSNGASPPVYAQQVQFTYLNPTSAGTSGSGLGACEPPSGSSFVTDLDPGMLCQVYYPDGSSTQLYYDTNGQLAEMVNPGGAVTGFTYTQLPTDSGPFGGQYVLSTIQSATATDWWASQGKTTAVPTTADTTIGYDTNPEATDPSAGYATSVKLPAPDGLTTSTQPETTYDYWSQPTATANGATYIDASGEQVGDTGHLGTVTYNQELQEVTSKSSMGLTTQSYWNNHDDLMAQISPTGDEETTAYDSQDRATDAYGPAPTSCFPSLPSDDTAETTGNQLPTLDADGGCAALSMPVAHTSTSYDGAGALDGKAGGLNATWYNNQTLSGPPAAYSLSIPAASGAVGGATDGSINYDWSTTTAGTVGVSPIAGPSGTVVGGSSGTDWTAQFEGLVTFPTAGTYTFYTYADDGSALWVDNQLVINNLVPTGPHFEEATSTFTITTPDTVYPIRLDYLNQAEGGQIQLGWVTDGTIPTTYSATSPDVVPAADLSPDYSLATSTQTDDSAPSDVSDVSTSQVPAIATATSYGSDPWLGLPASTTVAPGGLNLTTSATYETSSTGYDRQLTATHPAGSATTATNTYYPATGGYGSTEECGVPTTTPQYGMLEKTVGPTPAVGSAITTEFIYDSLGRVAGTWNSADATWACTTYDSSGLVTSQSYPALDGNPKYTVDYGYYVDGATSSPLITTESSPLTNVEVNGTTTTKTGTITTQTDLDGNVTSYTDVWGTVTTSSYNQLGQLTSQTSTPTDGTAVTLAFSYNADGQQTDETLAGADLADSTYNADGQLSGVSFPSATGDLGDGATGAFGYAPTGEEDSVDWTVPDGPVSVTDSHVLSQSGRVLQDNVTYQNSTSGQDTTSTSTYSYDAAGRLIKAVIPSNTLTYGFASTGGCGADAAAGADGNRTSFTDAYTAPGTTTTVTSSDDYCYDNADQLTGTISSGAPATADPVVADSLTEAGTSPTLTYDSHGNTTTLADQTLSYNGDNQLVSVSSTDGGTTAGASAISYVRDATGEVIQESTTTGGTTTTVDYSYDGSGGELSWILNASQAVTDARVSLPGGASVDLQDNGHEWSLPNLDGDTMVTTNSVGWQDEPTYLYDPFGNPLDPTTDQIETSAANQSLPPATSSDTTTLGFGGAEGKLTDVAGDIDEIQMGARQYSAELGRFLQMDPVPGGNVDAYVYPDDPINDNDWTGDHLYGFTNVGDIAFADTPTGVVTDENANQEATLSHESNSTGGHSSSGSKGSSSDTSSNAHPTAAQLAKADPKFNVTTVAPPVSPSQKLLAWTEIVGGVGAFAAMTSYLVMGAAEILVGAIGAPETGGLSLALSVAGAVEATTAAFIMALGVFGVADGINRLNGHGIFQ